MPAGRRARLTISRIDPWTVLKFSVALYICFYVILMVAGTALWVAGTVTGLRDNVESFVGDLISSPNFKFLGGRILQASVLGGAVLVAVGAGVNVLMAVLYNLISDVVGGVGVALDEPVEGAQARPGPRRRAARRRDGRDVPKPVGAATSDDELSGADGKAPFDPDAGTEPDKERPAAAATVTEAAGADSGPGDAEVTGIAKV